MRRITKAKITFITLCPRGMNGFKTLFKSDGDAFELHPIIKGFDEALGELTAVVYAPDIPDLEGELANQQVIKDAAYEYMRDHRNVDVRHNLKALSKEQAYLAESFIIAEGDKRFADFKDDRGAPRDVTGGWATVFKILDPALKEKYSSGEWAGVSMFGQSLTEEVSKSADDDIVERVAKQLGITLSTEEDDMKPEELAAVLKASNETMVATIKEVLAPAKTIKNETEETDANEDADPVFDQKRPVLKSADKEGYENLAKEMRAWEVAKKIFEGTITAEHIEEIAKSFNEPEITDEQAGIKKEDSPELKKARRTIYKMEQASGQRVDDGEDDDSNLPNSVSKEDRADVKLGSSMADFVNSELLGLPVEKA